MRAAWDLLAPYGARRKWSASPLSLTGQLAALIGQEDTGGHQDRAADNEGLTQQVGRIARGRHRRLPRRGLGCCHRMFGLVRHLRGGLGLLAIPVLGGLLASDLGVELDNSLIELGLGGGVVCKRLQVCRRHSSRRSRGSIELGLGGRGALGGIVSRSNLGVERLVRIVSAAVGNGFGKIDPAQTGSRGGRGIAGGSRIRHSIVSLHHVVLGIHHGMRRSIERGIGSGFALGSLGKRCGSILKLRGAGGSRVRLCLSRCHGGVGIARSLLCHIELRLHGSSIDVCLIGIALGGSKFGLRPALIGTSVFECRRCRIKRTLSCSNIGRVRRQLVLSSSKRALLVANTGTSGIQRTLGGSHLAFGTVELARLGSHDVLRCCHSSVGSTQIGAGIADGTHGGVNCSLLLLHGGLGLRNPGHSSINISGSGVDLRLLRGNCLRCCVHFVGGIVGNALRRSKLLT